MRSQYPYALFTLDIPPAQHTFIYAKLRIRSWLPVGAMNLIIPTVNAIVLAQRLPPSSSSILIPDTGSFSNTTRYSGSMPCSF
jgi:hypothetical protein